MFSSQGTLGPKLNKFPIKLPFIKQNEVILNSSTKKSKLLTVVFSTVRTDRVSMVLDRACIVKCKFTQCVAPGYEIELVSGGRS